MKTTSNWETDKIKTAALIRQAMPPGTRLTAEQIHQTVNIVFERADISPQSIRAAIPKMPDLTIDPRRGRSRRGRPCRQYMLQHA